jgi:hypothetical protein
LQGLLGLFGQTIGTNRHALSVPAADFSLNLAPARRLLLE